MYLHLGQSTVIHSDDVLGIFDLDTASLSPKTRTFLATAEKNGAVTTISQELPKSFVLCHDGHAARVFISQLSSATLLRRAELGVFEG